MLLQIPGDMVVNAVMVAHSEELAQSIYHVTSSVRNPVPYAILMESIHRYFLVNPPLSKDNGEPVHLSKMCFFSIVPMFQMYMAIKFRLPLKVTICSVSLFY